MESEERQRARQEIQQLAAELRQTGDIAGFFNAIYERAGGNSERIPWAHLEPNPLFRAWLEHHPLRGEGRRALQVGCGLGDDAEELAARGFAVTAFDIAPSAIAWCRRRFPTSRVDYQVADLLALPAAWQGHFDFILEIYTLQALPRTQLEPAIASITRCLAPGGSLLLICLGSDEDQEQTSTVIPRPLSRAELAGFEEQGLQIVTFEAIDADEEPARRRFRVHYRRP